MGLIQDTPLVDFPIVSGINNLTLSNFLNIGGGIIEASGIGDFSRKAYYDVDTCINNFFKVWRVRSTSASFEFGIGKDSGGSTSGTMITFDSSNNVKINSWVTTNTLVNTTPITGFSLTQNIWYDIFWRKSGYTYTIEIREVSGPGVFSTTYSWPTQSVLPGNGYGKPTLIAISGTIQAIDFSFSNNNLNAEFCVWGDSFTEGSAYAQYYESRWVKQVRDAIGVGSVFAAGRGGETILTLASRFSSELSWTINPKYVILAIGTNAVSNASFVSQLNIMLNLVATKRAIPILTTCVRTQQQANIDANNAWVRSSGYRHIEFANALTTDQNNNVWKPGFVGPDLIHPTDLGNNAMAQEALSSFSNWGFL